MKVQNIVVILLLTNFIYGCGSDGDSDLPENNSSGFPDVSGIYSFNQGVINAICNGELLSVPGSSFNINVIQNGNEIILTKTTVSSSPGITIYESTNPTGLIDKSGNFQLRNSSTGYVDQVGNVSTSSHYSGTFSSSGFTGIETDNFIFFDVNFSCVGESDISGFC